MLAEHHAVLRGLERFPPLGGFASSHFSAHQPSPRCGAFAWPDSCAAAVRSSTTPSTRTPVMHVSGDPVVPFNQGRRLASPIPSSRQRRVLPLVAAWRTGKQVVRALQLRPRKVGPNPVLP